MGFIKNALGMIGDAATGRLASGVGGFVNGLFGGGAGIDYHDQKKLMEKQHEYELGNMDYQANQVGRFYGPPQQRRPIVCNTHNCSTTQQHHRGIF